MEKFTRQGQPTQAPTTDTTTLIARGLPRG
jgi:hypothetical protein